MRKICCKTKLSCVINMTQWPHIPTHCLSIKWPKSCQGGQRLMVKEFKNHPSLFFFLVPKCLCCFCYFDRGYIVAVLVVWGSTVAISWCDFESFPGTLAHWHFHSCEFWNPTIQGVISLKIEKLIHLIRRPWDCVGLQLVKENEEKESVNK